MNGLISPEQFRTRLEEIEDLSSTDLAHQAALWSRPPGCTSAELKDLSDDLESIFSEEFQRLSWRPHAICAGMKGGTHRKVWETLAEKIAEASELGAKHSLNLHLRPALSSDFTVIEQSDLLDGILEHMRTGGSIGWSQHFTKPEWMKLIKTSRVKSGRPTKQEHFASLRLLARLRLLREDIEDLWGVYITQKGGPPFTTLGAEPEQMAGSVSVQISHCLDWHQTVWVSWVEKIKLQGLDYDQLAADVPFEPSATADYDLAAHVALHLLPEVLDAELRRRRLRECNAELQRHLQTLLDLGDDRGCIGSLVLSIRERDPERYTHSFRYTQRLHDIAPAVKERKALLSRLAIAAPSWSAAIGNRLSPHNTNVVPENIPAAWMWRQLDEELNRRHLLDPSSLQLQIEHNRGVLREVTLSLIELRAWVNQIRRVQTSHPIRQALVGWLDAIKKIQSTKKKDILWKLQSHARSLMKLSAKAVPVWIMPLAAVAENFDPSTTRFDVVIVDEASQADLNALIAMYQADKVMRLPGTPLKVSDPRPS